MVKEKEILDSLDALIKKRTLETDVKIQEKREENERLQVRGERYIGQINKVLKKHHVDIDSIFTVGKEEAKRSMTEVNRVKEKLKKVIKQHQGGSLNLLLSEGLPIHVLLSPYRTVMRGAVANVVDRSSGGPIDVGPLESIGEGWGISARGYPIVYLDRYFVLVPPRGGYYDFVVYQEYFGYCVVKAFDDWTSKFAEVRVEEMIRVTQGNRSNESNFVHFQRSGDTINIEGTLSAAINKSAYRAIKSR